MTQMEVNISNNMENTLAAFLEKLTKQQAQPLGGRLAEGNNG